jgi:uncharacterized protein with LGFP repeats
MSAIDDKRNQLPFLGDPVDEGAGSQEMDIGDGRGRVRDFQHGSIYFTAKTGAHEVHGDIRIHYGRHRGPRGFLGYPTTDELGTPDGRGRFNHFEGGSIYWTQQTGPHEVHGAILALWSEMGFERSRLGFPTSDEQNMVGGRISHFERGEIRWTQTGGPKAVIAQKFD